MRALEEPRRRAVGADCLIRLLLGGEGVAKPDPRRSEPSVQLGRLCFVVADMMNAKEKRREEEMNYMYLGYCSRCRKQTEKLIGAGLRKDPKKIGWSRKKADE